MTTRRSVRKTSGGGGESRAATPPLRAHRYSIGDQVTLSRGFGFARTAGAIYEVTALLPAERMRFQYRIRSQNEAFSRVAEEAELAPRRITPPTEGSADAQGSAAQQPRKAEAQTG